MAGWSVLSPKRTQRAQASRPPVVDVDTRGPAASQVALAASALARRGPTSNFLATSASAAGHIGEDARCGDDQEPVYGDPQVDPGDGLVHPARPTVDPDGVLRHLPGEIKPAGPGYTGAMRRIDAALRSSADPFDRAMADKLDLAQITPPEMRTEALVQDALAADDVRVYALAWGACHPSLGGVPGAATPSPGCARLSTARWAQLDPGDAQPWLWDLAAADKRGDVPAQREALARIAGSSRMNVRMQAGMAAVARLQLADADLAAQVDAATRALDTGPPASALTAHCQQRADGDADLASTCDRIATMLYDHADSLVWHAIGGAVHKQATGDASWLDRAHREQRLRQDRVHIAVKGSKPCGAAREGLRYMVRLGQVGEMQLAREALNAASAP